MGNKRPFNAISDHWAKTDALHFDTYLPALSEILTSAETPLTLGIFGPWGSGKTTLLHMLEKIILEKGLANYRAVWFTAWKYDKQDALWRALVLRVIEGLYPHSEGRRIPKDEIKDKQQQRGVEHLERLAQSLYQSVSWEDNAQWSLDLPVTAKETIKLPAWLAFHLAGLGDAAKEMGLNPDLTKIIKRESQQYHLNQLTSMEQFEAIFQEAIALILGKDGRLVVFVDDLDRCLPEKAIEILEAMKLFLNVPGTVFVLGMDRNVICRGIEGHYQALFTSPGQQDSPLSGDNYLQKLLQLSFSIPPLNLEHRREYIENLEKEIVFDEWLDPVTREVLARGLFPNPRQVKRALNTFRLLKKITENQERVGLIPNDTVGWPLLAKAALIQLQWPELYNQWLNYPTILPALEEEYSRHPNIDEISLQSTGLDETTTTAADKSGKITAHISPLLAPFLDYQSYGLLANLLTYPPASGAGRHQALFKGLRIEQLQIYQGLVGTIKAGEFPVPPSFRDRMDDLVSGDKTRIRDVIAMVDEQEADPKGERHQNLQYQLKHIAQNPNLPGASRLAAADVLDSMGWLPDDLSRLVKVSDGLWMGKYPVTNIQYGRFLDAADFASSEFWTDIPLFDENCQMMDEHILDAGSNWLQDVLKSGHPTGQNSLLPRSWESPLLGRARPCAPVVNIGWYEAHAYCKWVKKHWAELDEARQNSDFMPEMLRLPTENEWLMAAGGNEPANRFPWDEPGESLPHSMEEIAGRANVRESKLGCTSPVWMHPSGESRPHRLMDMLGNAWEWQANFITNRRSYLALRGCSWNDSTLSSGADSGIQKRMSGLPPHTWGYVGFRIVATSAD